MWENDLSKLFSGEQVIIILKVLFLILCLSWFYPVSTENRTWQKHDERDFSGKEKKKDMMGLSHDNMADLSGLNNLKNIISHNKES